MMAQTKMGAVVCLAFIAYTLLSTCLGQVANGQNRTKSNTPDTVIVYVRDTIYMVDTVWVKDGVLYSYNPDPFPVEKKKTKTEPSERKKPTEYVDAVSDITYRSLVDSLFTFGIEFDRDSLAKVILANDETFNTDWSTTSVHYSKADPRKMPKNIRFELIRGYETYKYNWFGGLTWGFGPRWGRIHKGLDTNLKEGDTLFASFNGIVRYAEFNEGGYGNCVVIRHFNGLETYYAHLSQLDVEPGDLVFTGELIGLGGTTGRSDGPHLHFEARYKSYAFDPYLILDKEKQLALIDNEFFLDKNKLHTESSEYADNGSNTKDKAKKPANDKATGAKYHTVKKGETLSSIAKKHKTTVEKIMKLNKLKNKNALRTGQKLRVR
jgi:murein DD-endopeptidase MepM/ murein hydrolase activator NlpD